MTGLVERLERFTEWVSANCKLVDQALTGMEGSYVELLTLLAIGLLAMLPVLVPERRRQLFRRLNQLLGIGIFIFLVYTCMGVFGMVRNFFRGFSEIGQDNIIALYFCSVPVTVLATAMIFGPTFCGWMCPTGAMQEFASVLAGRWLRRRATDAVVGGDPTSRPGAMSPGCGGRHRPRPTASAVDDAPAQSCSVMGQLRGGCGQSIPAPALRWEATADKEAGTPAPRSSVAGHALPALLRKAMQAGGAGLVGVPPLGGLHPATDPLPCSPFPFGAAVVLLCELAVFFAGLLYLSRRRVFFIEDSSIYWAEVILILQVFLLWRMRQWDGQLRRLRALSLWLTLLAAVAGWWITSPVHLVFTKVYDPASLLSTVIVVMAALTVPQCWCRYLCPWREAIGWASRHSTRTLVTSSAHCTGCGRCDSVCNVEAVHKGVVNMRECHLCLRCVDNCPTRAIRFVEKWKPEDKEKR